MMDLLAFLSCIVAFGALALAMERHQQAIFAALLPPLRTRLLRAAGWLGLLLALWLLVAHRGWALGLVHYSGQTSVAAGLVHGVLIWRERRHAARR
ncbi:DUF3325 domain-containing protein [Cupriavidus gilardii]|uniref:DUF3325 family protein n=2 Tax=Cupriavidus gilardii TaxID=82541 RepID=A0A849BI80_9BURK|nr:DUF3325 family protein [Cupriavidus gilardii]KAB0597608.1 DUF3325 domain-containing protein [Cupriavidus gilardii]MCT9014603.1 DUF3325 domain-containing protein [Cupriavidus gilardii]MCT9117787.1 DUF3325 domain-containing protein [Cupriavidus gilardii]NNH12257.1 DUF3325 family protein [Cupriavidus gilardii]WNG68270.1 DUF3325 family protein [Cupriavidus gilardii]